MYRTSANSAIALFLVLVLCCWTSAARESDPFLAALEAIRNAEGFTPDGGDNAREARLTRAYEASGFGRLTGEQRRTLSDEQAKAVYEGSHLVAFYTRLPEHVARQVEAFNELQRRGLVDLRTIFDTYEALISTRDFKGARRFAAAHPSAGLPPTPAFKDVSANAKKTEMVVGEAGASLTRQEAKIDSDTTVFVVGHPRCHFTQRAVRDIEADPRMRTIFRQHAKWIAPQDRELDFSVFDQWNKEHPYMTLTVVYRKDEWPLFTDWSTPLFYFVKDGRVVDTIAGWPKQGRMAELANALRKLGYFQP